MRTLLVVTHVDFWGKGAGHRARLSSMINYLKDHLSITVVYAGIFSDKDATIISREYTGIEVVALEPTRTITFREHAELFRSFIAGKNFDAVLVEYIEMSFALPLVNQGCLTLLDTHDLVVDRIRSFRKNGIPYGGISMSDEEELAIFNCFDKVLLIQENDYQKIGSAIGYDRAILVPHAPNLRKRAIDRQVRNIGFVASEYPPNVEAIRWYIDEVWSERSHDNITLNIYGNVSARLDKPWKESTHDVVFHGFVKDLDVVYDNCDIMINPVNAGAGMKIKNMEAMAAGLPLITTPHGAAGITSGIDTCFLIADSAGEFTSALDKLIRSEELRTQLGTNAFAFVAENFSATRCYSELRDLILQYQLTG